MATKVVKSLNVTSNYMNLQNLDDTKVNIINRIAPPANVWEGYLLILEFDKENKGGGVFIKNKTTSDSVGNLRLNCWGRETAAEYGLMTKISTNAGTSLNKNSLGHITDALKAIRDADNTARNNAINALDASLSTNAGSPYNLINTGAFAYGLGGADFIKGAAVRDTQDGVDYYDYSSRPPLVLLVWNGTYWIQESPLSLNAIS